MTRKDKSRFKGEFNVYGQCFILYTWATSSYKAYQNFISQLNIKTNIPRFQLLCIFNHQQDNLRIMEVAHD